METLGRVLVLSEQRPEKLEVALAAGSHSDEPETVGGAAGSTLAPALLGCCCCLW